MSFSAPDFEAALQNAAQTHLPNVPPNLREAILYSLLAPGKRIRPRIVYAAGRLLGLADRVALTVGVAIEMVHCFSLIHDDLPCMDNDDFRRGQPSNHKAHGESTALLAGDALAFLGIECLLDLRGTTHAAGLTNAVARLVRLAGAPGMVGGQAAEALLTPQSSLEDIRSMQALKTGALFQACVLIPSDLSGLESGTPRAVALETFGRNLGWAFQVADDLADESQDGSRREINVLSRITREEAAQLARSELQSGLAGIEKWFGPASTGLAAIAAEVLAMLAPEPRKS